MPILSHIHVEEFCSTNRTLLIEQRLVDQNQYIDLGEVNIQERKNLINKLLENEKNNKEAIVKLYQKEKNKVEYILQSMMVAVIFLGAGLALAQLFIASTVILPPIFPFLLVGFAIIAATKLILSVKTNSLEADKNHVVDILKELKEARSNLEQETIENFGNEIKDIKRTTIEQTENISDKIDVIEGKATQIISKLFPAPSMSSIPIPTTEPANEFLNKESMSHS